MKTAVVIDSGSNYYNEDMNVEGLYAIPLQIIEGEKTYLESIEISNEEVNKKMQEGIRLKTSLPIIGNIEKLFKTILDDGYDRIFAVPITSGISGTLEAMATAAKMLEIPFDYIDCYTTMHIQLYCSLKAIELFNKDEDLNSVKTQIKEIVDHSNTFIIPDDLDHLSAGGRLSPMAAKLGGLLRIKPILHLDKSTNGVIEPFDKVRTMKRSLQRVVKAFEEENVDDTYKITVTDVDNDKDAKKIIELIKEKFPNIEITRRSLISTVSAHVGPGSIALQYYKTI